MEHIPQEGYDPGDWWPRAEQMQERAKKNKKTGAGLDGWANRYLAALPLQFWEEFEKLIHAILKKGASLPQAWNMVRVTLIPKPDGGTRPIGVASALWRLIGGVICNNLIPWTFKWLHPSMFGGIPNRGIDDIHHIISCIIAKATEEEGIMGFKTDLSKCFDRIDVDAALCVLERMGLPKEVQNLIKNFYRDQATYFNANGLVTQEPFPREIGALQGCSFSVMFILAFQAILSVSLEKEIDKRANDDGEMEESREDFKKWFLGSFLDDRIILTWGKAKRRLYAIIANYIFDADKCFGFVWNYGKRGTICH